MRNPALLRPAAVLMVVWACTSCSGGGSTDPAATAPSKPAPLAVVVSPPSAAVVQTSPILIAGHVDQPDTSVTVGGIAATVTNGRFSASIPLAEGSNAIDVVATNANGQTTTTLAVTLSGNEMCGTGDTFDVPLPGLTLSKDPSTEDLTNRKLPNDSVTLPNGCDVYAIIVHGYGRNSLFDELMYYKLAKWVAEHNGYVHYSWWNNLLGEYQSGPLHVISGTARGDATYPSPGDITQFENVWDFAQGGSGKAVPDEDFQFQADAKRVLTEIRNRNPKAIVIVAGHSMGGNAVARLGSDTPVAIDLLAPIDPVGNRNLPEGQGGALGFGNGSNSAVPGDDKYDSGNETFNWTRWRATRNFFGWVDRDCVRNAVNLCRDFDSRPLRVDYHCRTVDTDPSDTKHPNGPIADKSCPDVVSYSTVALDTNIRRLYHRWQLETYFPYDWDASYHFAFKGERVHSDPVFEVRFHNYQRAVGEYSLSDLPPPAALTTAPKTCKHDSEADPSGARSFDGALLDCRDWDGHGEIIGMRGTKDRRVFQNTPPLPNKENLNPLALTADWNPNWNRTAPWLTATARRQAFITLAEPGPWKFAPKDPDLDLVVADLVAIAEDLWIHRGEPTGPDITPPTSSADVTPEPTIHGWNNSPVVAEIAAVDEQGGSGVKEIEYMLTGASTGNGVVAGAALSLEITAEGTTTVKYSAHDNAGNREEPNTLEVRIDVTPPNISADVAPAPNEHGWNNTDVTVTFIADDALSGIDTVSEPVTLTDEGAEQEVIGVATDRAGNTATIGVVVNIDKTPPVIGGLPEHCELWPPNHKLVSVADLVITDALSGVASSSATGASSEPDGGPGYGNQSPDIVIADGAVRLRAERYSQDGRTYDLAVTATDLAGNVTDAEASCLVPHDQGK